jgi:hypothetical protein
MVVDLVVVAVEGHGPAIKTTAMLDLDSSSISK